jgi:hypothetical protein
LECAQKIQQELFYWGGKILIQCTRRESDVLVLLVHGLSNKAIALRLGLSAHTVRDHVCSLMRAMGYPIVWNLPSVPENVCGRLGTTPTYRLTKVPATAWKDSEWVLLS